MPIARSHKRWLKTCRLEKKRNFNKEKNVYAGGVGTGLRGLRSLSDYEKYQGNKTWDEMQDSDDSDSDNNDNELTSVTWDWKTCHGDSIYDTYWLNTVTNETTHEEPPHPYVNNPDLWSAQHIGQVMESQIHDRTRWKSSKEKSIQRKNSRNNKLSSLD